MSLTRETVERPRTRLWVPAGSRNHALGLIPYTAVTLDLVLVASAVLFATWGRQEIRLAPGQSLAATDLGWAPYLTIAAWIIAIQLLDGYRREIFGAGVDEYRRVWTASLLTAGVVGVACYLANYPLPRAFFVLAFAAGTLLLVAGRFLLRRTIQQARRQGNLLHKVVVAGSSLHVDETAAVLARQPWLGYSVVGAVTPPSDVSELTDQGTRVWGNTDDLGYVVKTCGADTVLVTGGAFRSSRDMRQAVWDLEQHNVQVVVAPSVTDVARERVRIRPVGGLPLIHLDPPRHERATTWAKRGFDVVGSLVLLACFAPVFLFAALRIRGYDSGPVIFRQTRVGRDGTEFDCLKFRTMVTNAEELLEGLQREMGWAGGLFKLKHDPRVTRPGRWLRRYSLDELPQLVNVLRGEMSLVGPRPPLLTEVATYDDMTHRRLRVRPGMTGLWQVSGRSDLAEDEAVRLDLYYVDNWSMLQDLVILMRTFSAVFGSRGAY